MIARMHPWHDVPVDEEQVHDRFPVLVEIPKGSKNKYEIDVASGLLRLDRVLHGAVHYPADYGFVPRTLSGDGDPIDCLVLASEPVVPRSLVPARAVGMFRTVDDGEEDVKILAVGLADPSFAHIRHADQLPPHLVRQVERFLRDYKALEGKVVEVDGFDDAAAAVDKIRASFVAYRERFGDGVRR
jgi:inorganic pyrophosphatase